MKFLGWELCRRPLPPLPFDRRNHSIPVDRRERTPQEQLDWWLKTGRMDLPESA